MSIIEKVAELKTAMEEYFGVDCVDIDVKIHSSDNKINETVLSRFHALGDVEFDGGKSSYDNIIRAWLKKKLSPNNDIVLYFRDYEEAQGYGYKLPEEAENDNNQ